jgi:hypothetical protein
MKRNGARGFVLHGAIIVIMLLAFFGATFFKKALQSHQLIQSEQSQRFDLQRVLTDADGVETSVAARLDLPSGLYTASPKTDAEMQYDMQAWVGNFISTYNTQNQSWGGRPLSLECLFQLRGTTPEPCSMQREILPKRFKMRLTHVNSETMTVVTTVQEFHVGIPVPNQFGFLLLGSDQTREDHTVKMGNVTVDGAAGIFFGRISRIASLAGFDSKVVFSGSSPGSIFNGTVVTNLPDSSRFVQKPGALTEFRGGVMYNAKGVSSPGIQMNFGQLAATAPATALTEAQAINNCLGAGFASPACHARLDGVIQVSSGSACDVQVTQRVSWSDDNNPANAGTLTEVLYNGPQVDGGIYRIKGTAIVKSPTGAPSVICQKQTFLSDRVQLNNSILKANPKANASVLSNSDISLAPTDQMYLMVGGTNQLVSTFKASGTSVADDPQHPSVRFEMAMVAPHGSVVLPSTYYDSNQFVTLGNFSIDGLVVTKQPLCTSQPSMVAGSQVDAGFSSMKIRQDMNMLTDPPPGASFNIVKGLERTVVSVSNSNVDIADAISRLSSY